MRFNLRRRDIFLIGSLWLIGIMLLGLAFYFGVRQGNASTSAEIVFTPETNVTVVYTDFTAQTSQVRALEHARQIWTEDAELMAVSSTWEQTDMNQVGQPSPWTYRFYSPSQRRLFFVTVTPEGEIIGTLHGEILYKNPPWIPLEDWSIDSSEAINIWLNHGGATMLEGIPGIQVVAQLQVRSEDSPLTWTVAGYDRVSQNYHTVFIDAKRREVLQIESSLR